MTTRADREAWREYVAGEIRAFYDHCDGVTYIWANTPAADRLVARLGGDSETAAYTGPWHVIRPHVTGEFRQWVEEYRLLENRLTLSAFRERGIRARAELEYSETPEYTLGKLTELRRLIADRDRLICEAAARGASKVAIAAAVGLSRQAVHGVIAAAELAPVTPIGGDSFAPVHEHAAAGVEWVRNATTGDWEEVF